MPAERVSMRQAREIARRLGRAPSTVRETLSRLESAGFSWPLPEGIGDAELEAALYANRRSKRGHRRHAEPDWPAVHRELKRKHVTLLIVWDELSRPTPAATAIRGFANSIAALKQSCHRRCGRRTRRANGCSSITRATGSRSSLTSSPGKSAWRRSSSPCSAPRASPSRTRAGRRRSPRAGQYEDRRHQGVPLRSSGQSDLCRNGGALRSRHFAGAAAAAPRQSQG